MEDQPVGEHNYEVAEEAFLAGVRNRLDHSTLGELAADVAAQASAWNSSAYARFHAATGDAKRDLDSVTERTEVLEGLWADIARAFRGQLALRDG